MKTHKIIRALFVSCLIAFAILPASAIAKTKPAVVENPQRVAELQTRLNEINAMNKSNLSRKEKKALRAEVKEIKEEMEGVSGGVYLSVGAIIIIALLLILLL